MFAVAANERCLVAAGFRFNPCADLFSQPRQLPGVLRIGGPHRMRWLLRAFLILHAGLRELFRDAALGRVRRPITE